MAIFHLSVKIITRSKGRSAVAAAAYRHAMRLTDERTGTTHDYRRKGGVLHSEILAPVGIQIAHRARLWNTVERCEKRRDAQLAREIEIGLPAELALEQQLALTRAWVQAQLVERGIIADIAIHDAGSGSDSRNTHAHIMLTLRRVSPAGFGQKDRGWGNRAMLQEWRKSWADTCNEHLAMAGSLARIDHRSLKAQGIDRLPTIKRGPAAAAIDRQAGRTMSDRGSINAAIGRHNRQTRLLRVLRVQVERRILEGPHHFADLAQELVAEEIEIEPHTRVDFWPRSRP